MLEKIEQQFNRFSISKNDFVEAFEYLNELNNDLSQIVQRSLLSSAIVAYSRPFSNNKGGHEQKATNTAQINISKLFTQKEIELHKKVIELRNEGVAHSDYDQKPTSRVPFDGSGVITWSKPFNPLSENINVTLFKNMAKTLEAHCVTKLIEINRKRP